MADNVAITAGSGTTIAADDIGGILHQRVKISQGADGSATDVSSAAPLQVTLANTGANTNKILTTPDLPSGASTAAKQPALGTAGTASTDVITVQGIASMTALKVDGSAVTQPVSAASLPLPTGAATAAKQPALGTAGSASTDVITIQGIASGTVVPVSDGAGSLTVDNAGTFAVQAAQSGTWTVQPGNTANTTAWKVDASSVAVPVTDNSGSLTVDYATTGSGTATGALRVELPTNGTGVIATVGSVTAITNALPAGTNAIGKLAANSGVDIGDVDVTTVGTITPGTAATSLGKAEDATHTSGDTGVMMLGIRNDALAATAGTDLDYIPPTLAADGRIVTVAAPTAAMVTGTASVTDTTSTSLIAAGAGSLRNYITAVQFANTGSTTVLVTLQDGSGGTALARSIIPAGGGSNIYYDIPIKTTAATALYFAAGGSSTTVYASAQGYRAL